MAIRGPGATANLDGIRALKWRFGNFADDGSFVEESRAEKIARLRRQVEFAQAELDAALSTETI